MEKKIYISGPMTGIEGFNYCAFFAAERKLKKAGFETFNPFIIGDKLVMPEESTKAEKYNLFMKADIKALMQCDSIYMLPGWKESKGAMMEVAIAKFFDMEFHYDEKKDGSDGNSIK